MQYYEIGMVKTWWMAKKWYTCHLTTATFWLTYCPVPTLPMFPSLQVFVNYNCMISPFTQQSKRNFKTDLTEVCVWKLGRPARLPGCTMYRGSFTGPFSPAHRLRFPTWHNIECEAHLIDLIVISRQRKWIPGQPSARKLQNANIEFKMWRPTKKNSGGLHMDSLRFQAGYSCGLSQVKTQIFYNLTFRPAILQIENWGMNWK